MDLLVEGASLWGDQVSAPFHKCLPLPEGQTSRERALVPLLATEPMNRVPTPDQDEDPEEQDLRAQFLQPEGEKPQHVHLNR